MDGMGKLALVAAVLCSVAQAIAAAPNILYMASGTFATPALAGQDMLGIAGEPFSITIRVNESA